MKFHGIRENHLYRRVYQNGRSNVTPTVAVHLLRDRKAHILQIQNPTKEKYNRIGIQASKKIGGAVQRNRAKRVIREALRKIDLECGMKKGYLIVISPRTKCVSAGLHEVEKDLRESLSVLGILGPEEGGEGDMGPVEPADRESR